MKFSPLILLARVMGSPEPVNEFETPARISLVS